MLAVGAPDAYEEKLVWGVQSWLKAVTPGSPNKHSIPIFFFFNFGLVSVGMCCCNCKLYFFK